MTILQNAKKAEELSEHQWLGRILLVGPSGSGKSRSAVTLPLINNKPILVIDLDGRGQALSGIPNIEILTIQEGDTRSPRAWRDLEAAKNELKALVKKDFPYSAIIEDGLTMMNRISMRECLLLDPKRGLGGAPAKQHYMPQMKYLTDHISDFLSMPCHYVLTAHLEYIEEEEVGGIHFLPKTTGKLRSEIPGWFDETYLCQRSRKKEGLVYEWATGGGDRYNFCKSGLNREGRFWTDPVQINLDENPHGFRKLLRWRFKDANGTATNGNRETSND